MIQPLFRFLGRRIQIQIGKNYWGLETCRKSYKICNIFFSISGEEPRKVIFKDDLGCNEAGKEQNSSKEDCDQQRVDSEPVTNNQGKGNSFIVPGEAESSNTCINIRVKWFVEYKI